MIYLPLLNLLCTFNINSRKENKELYDESFSLGISKVLIILAPNDPELLAKAGVLYESIKKSISGFHLFLVPFNSLKYCPSSVKQSDIWKFYMRLGCDKSRGVYLSGSDRAKLEDIATQIIRFIIIPYATDLLKEVKKTKISSLLELFEKKSGINSERKLRLSADLAFFLQNYNTAISLYQNILQRLTKVKPSCI